jgi:hypothetical protein
VIAWAFACCWGVASATTHTPAYTPKVVAVTVDNPSFHRVANTMMYTLTVTVDDTWDNARHDAMVGFTTRGRFGGDVSECPAQTAYTWSPHVQRFDAPTRRWTLYNFQPGEEYYYAIRTGTRGNYEYSCGALETAAAPTPTLPIALADLNLIVDNSSGEYHTKYVLFDSDDCGGRNHLLAVDADTGNIVWYLDVKAVTGVRTALIGGWRYQAAGSSYLSSDRLLLALNAFDRRQLLYEVEFDGTVINAKDFNRPGPVGERHRCDGSSAQSLGPCPHHDAFKSDLTGETFALVTANSGLSTVGNPFWTRFFCEAPPYRFMADGFQVLDHDYAESFTQYLVPDLGYDPAVDGGPRAPQGCLATTGWANTLSPEFKWLDWTHANSISGTPDGEFLDISLKEWDQIIRVRADGSGSGPEWRLAGNPDYSDFELSTEVLGPATFAGQHDPHMLDSATMMLFDNLGNPGEEPGTAASRVLQLALDEDARTAAIEKAWVLTHNNDLPTSLECPTKGSGHLVPGDPTGNSVLALCHESYAIEELNDPTGAEERPSLYITLPRFPADVCPEPGPSSREVIQGWYRAYPLENLGDF